jgi:hypothetical protein
VHVCILIIVSRQLYETNGKHLPQLSFETLLKSVIYVIGLFNHADVNDFQVEEKVTLNKINILYTKCEFRLFLLHITNNKKLTSVG